MISDFVVTAINIAATFFIFLIGLAILALAIIYVLDITQTCHAIRRNFPVIGRLRYFFEHMGAFFRQYFFAADHEEMPFNREQRNWVYRAAKNVDNTVAFGSTRDLRRRTLAKPWSSSPAFGVRPISSSWTFPTAISAS